MSRGYDCTTVLAGGARYRSPLPDTRYPTKSRPDGRRLCGRGQLKKPLGFRDLQEAKGLEQVDVKNQAGFVQRHHPEGFAHSNAMNRRTPDEKSAAEAPRPEAAPSFQESDSHNRWGR